MRFGTLGLTSWSGVPSCDVPTCDSLAQLCFTHASITSFGNLSSSSKRQQGQMLQLSPVHTQADMVSSRQGPTLVRSLSCMPNLPRVRSTPDRRRFLLLKTGPCPGYPPLWWSLLGNTVNTFSPHNCTSEYPLNRAFFFSFSLLLWYIISRYLPKFFLKKFSLLLRFFHKTGLPCVARKGPLLFGATWNREMANSCWRGLESKTELNSSKDDSAIFALNHCRGTRPSGNMYLMYSRKLQGESRCHLKVAKQRPLTLCMPTGDFPPPTPVPLKGKLACQDQLPFNKKGKLSTSVMLNALMSHFNEEQIKLNLNPLEIKTYSKFW